MRKFDDQLVLWVGFERSRDHNVILSLQLEIQPVDQLLVTGILKISVFGAKIPVTGSKFCDIIDGRVELRLKNLGSLLDFLLFLLFHLKLAVKYAKDR